jgi:hypothetical protein
MAGQTINTRSNIGFIAVDAEGFAAWVYYVRAADGAYELDLQPDATTLEGWSGTRSLDLDRALDAASKGLDVIALPGEGDDEQPAEPPVFDDDVEEGGY